MVMWQMVIFVLKLFNRYLTSLHRRMHREKNFEMQEDWPAVLLDINAKEHFLTSSGQLI